MAGGGARRGSGPKPKPSALKLLTGTAQKSRENADEPEMAAPNSLSCPEWFVGNEEAVKIWDWAVKVLFPSGILKEADIRTLEKYCLCELAIKSLFTDLSVEGWTLADGKANPKASIFNNMLSQSRQFSEILGLTPSSRSRLKVDKNDKPKDGFDKMLRDKK